MDLVKQSYEQLRETLVIQQALVDEKRRESQVGLEEVKKRLEEARNMCSELEDIEPGVDVLFNVDYNLLCSSEEYYNSMMQQYRNKMEELISKARSCAHVSGI